MIRFPCPTCNKQMAVDNSYAGRNGRCSWCGGAITVPHPNSPGTTTDEERDPALTAVAESLRSKPKSGRSGGTNQDTPEIDISLKAYPQTSETDLTPGDWLLCVLCSGIGCIVGIVRLIQGRPNAGKMIGISLVFSALWTFLRVVIENAIRNQP